MSQLLVCLCIHMYRWASCLYVYVYICIWTYGWANGAWTIINHLYIRHDSSIVVCIPYKFMCLCIRMYTYIYGWVISHIYMNGWWWLKWHLPAVWVHVWVSLYIWMSHVAHVIESCRTNEWVMSHICIYYTTALVIALEPCASCVSAYMSHVPHNNESCRKYYIHHCDVSDTFFFFSQTTNYTALLYKET